MSHSNLHIKRPTFSFLGGMASKLPQWARNVEVLDLSPCLNDPRNTESTKPPSDLAQRAGQLTGASGKVFLEELATRTIRPQVVVAGTSLSQAAGDSFERTNRKKKAAEKKRASEKKKASEKERATG